VPAGRARAGTPVHERATVVDALADGAKEKSHMTTTYRPAPPAIVAGAATAPATPEPRRRGVSDVAVPVRVRWYVRERWLVVLLGAFVPMGIALALPLDLRGPLVGASLIMAAVGLIMLARRPGGSTGHDWYTAPHAPSDDPAATGAWSHPDVPAEEWPADHGAASPRKIA
jgi:hypothetical protein